MKMPGKWTGPKFMSKSLGKWRDDIWEAMTWQEEWTDRMWCRKCSGYGPKLMNCCKAEPTGTQGYGKTLKRIQVLEEGSVQAKETRKWRIVDKREESQEKSIRGF